MAAGGNPKGGQHIGVFGGTFDPIHTGHLIVAECALDQLGLERVLFVPAKRSPLKPDREMASDAHRLRMVELAIEGHAGFAISRVDLDRPAPSYTVDTLAAIQNLFGPDTELHFIMGGDSLADLLAWREPERILEMARIAAYERPAADIALETLSAGLPALFDRIDWIEGPRMGISASAIRAARSEGHSVRYQVPDKVLDHMERAGLYTEASDPSPKTQSDTSDQGPLSIRDRFFALPELLIASNNQGKVRDFRELLDALGWTGKLLSPADLGLDLDVVEDGENYAANALLKAQAFASATGLPALADDSGIEVDALDGFPGLHSARWHPGSDADRMMALLERMQDVPTEARTARYRAAVVLLIPAENSALEHSQAGYGDGSVEGRLAIHPSGGGGFGYDPIFLVEDGGHEGSRTMAELSEDEKNAPSHRARALIDLVAP